MEKGKEATGTEEETKDCSCADGNVPTEKKVANKVEGEEELHPYMTMAWDPPRRSINY